MTPHLAARSTGGDTLVGCGVAGQIFFDRRRRRPIALSVLANQSCRSWYLLNHLLPFLHLQWENISAFNKRGSLFFFSLSYTAFTLQLSFILLSPCFAVAMGLDNVKNVVLVRQTLDTASAKVFAISH